MKKIIVPIFAFVFAVMLAMSACEGPIDDDRNDEGSSTLTAVLQAYNIGKKYFEETATSYESTYEGKAKPLGLGSIAGEQQVFTRRYLAENGDFIYDTANYSGGGIDVSFSLLVAKEGAESDYFYKKFNGKKHLREEDGVIYSDYSGQERSAFTTASAAEIADTCGFVPRSLLNYVVTEDTISSVEDYKLGEAGDQFALSFKIKMRSSAHASYKKQVDFCSGHSYSSFGSLTLEFGIDAEGRIVQISTVEEYSVRAGVKQKMRVEGTQKINYNKKPNISFEDFSAS